jgi:hypothetical protein
MTGVGRSNLSSSSSSPIGKSLAVVARPEIVLEGLDPHNKNDWKEIPFIYKPTNISDRPKFVAPHQPRLDWQMWFAALASYQSNPWLVHLIFKLLQTAQSSDESKSSSSSGCSSYFSNDVLDLIDRQLYPFNISQPPIAIRAILYDYDFTRWNTSWSRQSLDVSILNQSGDYINSSSVWDGDTWYRRNRRDYLPALSLDNESLKQFLKGNNIALRCYRTPNEQFQRCLDSAGVNSSDSFGLRKAACSSVLLRSTKWAPNYVSGSMQLPLLCLTLFLSLKSISFLLKLIH